MKGSNKIKLKEKQMDNKVNDEQFLAIDYTLSPEERVKRVEEILAATPSEKLTPYYLEKLSSYITKPTTKEESKQKYILTDNHMKTINKRETSFEGLVGKLENGEDGIYNMIANDKNIIFSHNKQYTQKDINQIPGLRDYLDCISAVQEDFNKATGKRRYFLKKQLIEMHQDKFELGKSYKKPIYMMNLIKSLPKIDLTDNIQICDNGATVTNNGIISFFNPAHISILLCNYSALKEESWDKFNSDIKWMMEDLDTLIEETLREDYPLYYDLLIYKIDGRSNTEIRSLLNAKHGTTHTVEYLSSLWRNKIPKLIAERAETNYIEWYYTFKEKGKYKKCSRCGQIKLANNKHFSKNSTSKDGFYSICKDCRNKKKN